MTVVEHPAFASLYQQELAQEGLPLEIVELDRVPATTISIFPDEAHKDVNALNIQIPTLSAGFRIVPKLEGLTIQDVKKAFKPYKPLPIPPSSPQPPSPRAGEGGEEYGSAPLSQLGRGAGGEGIQWHYLYIPQGVFERMAGDTVAELARACAPALQNLLQAEEFQDLPLFVNLGQVDEEASAVDSLIDPAILNALPSRYRRAADQSVMLYRFFENKEGMNYAPVFTALLGSIDEVAKGFLVRRLQPEMPVTVDDQKAWFAPYLGGVDRKAEDYYRKLAQNLKRTLVFNNGLSLIGLLRSCLDYALNDTTKIGGVFEALQTQLGFQGGRKFLEIVTRINDFRNTYIAHQEQELTDTNLAEQELKIWIEALHMIAK